MEEATTAQTESLRGVVNVYLGRKNFPDPTKLALDEALEEWKSLQDRLGDAKNELVVLGETQFDEDDATELELTKKRIASLEAESIIKISKVVKEYKRFEKFREIVFGPLKGALLVRHSLIISRSIHNYSLSFYLKNLTFYLSCRQAIESGKENVAAPQPSHKKQRQLPPPDFRVPNSETAVQVAVAAAAATSEAKADATGDIEAEAELAAQWSANILANSKLAKKSHAWSSRVTVEYDGERYDEFKDMPLQVLRYFIYLMKEGVPLVDGGYDGADLQSIGWIKRLGWTERECLRALVFMKSMDFKPEKSYPYDKSMKKGPGYLFVPTGAVSRYRDFYALRLSFVLYPEFYKVEDGILYDTRLA